MHKILLLNLIIIFTTMNSQSRQFAARPIQQKIVIDGQIEDQWNKIQSESNFKQEEPIPFANATVKTEFKFSYDEEHIYFLVKSYQDKSKLVTQSGRRDQSFNSCDYIMVYIDPLLDKSSGYWFGLNPSNVQADARIYNNSRDDEDWNAIWESETKIYEKYWVAELKIPVREIKYQSTKKQSWGINVSRYYKYNNETIFWQEVDPSVGFKVSNLGKVLNIENLSSNNEINLIPSAITVFDNTQNYDASKGQILSLDARYNIDSRHSFVATIKPDFAQIEADDDVINFSDYPTNLREKRPFFIEGNDLYSFHDEVYYSRRMTKPDLGLKFFGQSGNFKYGFMYVQNDAFNEDITVIDKVGIESTLARKTYKEKFILPILRYIEGSSIDIAYFGGYVQSDYNLSGEIHTIDAEYQLNDHFIFSTLYATTNIDNNNVYSNIGRKSNNFSSRFQLNYRFDDFYGRLKLQKKTNDFEQSLIGRWEPNNVTESQLSVTKRIRFTNSDVRNIDFSLDYFGDGTYDNNVISYYLRLMSRLNFKLKKFGDLSFRIGYIKENGEFRHYDYDSSKLHSKIHRDNNGQFIGVAQDHDGYLVRFNTDFSKPFAISFANTNYVFKQSEINRIRPKLQFRPNDDTKIELSLNYTHIKGSNYIDPIIYRSLSLRNQVTLTSNLFLKTFNQFNNQSKQFSNNLVLTYEYIRGSFLYFAYTEVGEFDDDFNKGTLFTKYRLNNRTISMKFNYSFYL